MFPSARHALDFGHDPIERQHAIGKARIAHGARNARTGASQAAGACVTAVTTGPAPFDLALDLPETERAAAEVLSIPVAPHLTDAEVIRVGEALLEAVGA